MSDSTTSRLCECGCGQPVARRYRPGHNKRGRSPQYVEQDCGYSTPCWVWIWSLDKHGYGQVSAGTRVRRAHAIYWERKNGPVPEGKELDHLCLNHACVNPDHLEPVTHKENVRRGRRAKLNPDDVRAIRRRADAGERRKDIAADYGTTTAHIRCVHHRRCWVDIF